MQTHKKRAKHNKTSTPKGVYYSESDKLWEARICIGGDRINIGWYKIKEDAIKARQDYERLHIPEVYNENAQKFGR